MRLFVPILLTVALTLIGMVLVDLKVPLEVFYFHGALALYGIFAGNYTTFQSKKITNAEIESGTVYYNISVLNGWAVVNRSGLGTSYDNANPITFISV
jgi:hypothetical protein